MCQGGGVLDTDGVFVVVGFYVLLVVGEVLDIDGVLG
jgi:hypothetical protein